MRNLYLTIGILLAASVSYGAAQVLDPKQIPAEADLRGLTDKHMSIQSALLYRWRLGTSDADPVPSPANMTFDYFQSGSGLLYPTKSHPGDHTANDQNDIWSNNVIRLDYTRGNQPNEAILIYTDNFDQGDRDPLAPVALRGGLVGGEGCNTACLDSSTMDACLPAHEALCAGRSSILPLIWKALPVEELKRVSGVSINGAIPLDSRVWMPTEIENQSGGFCPAEGPYNQSSGVQRIINGGFCDFSTHYVLDIHNLDPNNLWYNDPFVKDRTKAFNYASVVGPYGVNLTESGLGNGQFNPVYILLGVKTSNALRTTYRGQIYIEVLIR